MKNYVISLATAQNRREHITQEFAKQNMPFDFFDAVIPKTSFDMANKLNLDINHHNDLSPNEISCFLSHVSLWQKAIDENLDYIAIFEDDVYLSNTANQFLSNTNWIPSDVHIIKIEKINEKINKLKNTKMINKHQLGKLSCVHIGAGGYILSSKAIKSLLNFIKNKPIEHIDQILFRDYFTSGEYDIWQINPVLCIQDCILYPDNQKFQTYLQWREKIDKPNKIKLSFFRKLIREVIRPFKQLCFKIFYPKITLVFK